MGAQGASGRTGLVTESAGELLTAQVLHPHMFLDIIVLLACIATTETLPNWKPLVICFLGHQLDDILIRFI